MNEANIELIRQHLHQEQEGQYEAVLAGMTDPPEYYLPGPPTNQSDPGKASRKYTICCLSRLRISQSTW